MVILSLVAASALGLSAAFAWLLAGDGFSAIDGVLLALFAVSTPWFTFGFWNSVVGLVLLTTRRRPALDVCPPALDGWRDRPLRGRTALLMPIHNENPDKVFAHIRAMADELSALGVAPAFDVHILSDTTEPLVAEDEDRLFTALRRTSSFAGGLHYRRRTSNHGYKNGNLWAFLNSRGADYDHMVILDADSLMAGRTIIRAVRVMEANPQIGIFQTLAIGLPSRSAFTRIFQFGMRHGMRAYATGAAWWQGDAGCYWGHNAVIRVQPFMQHCGLPVLPGRPPFGGLLLSHDQVEAVLMRNAGFEVRVLPEEDGSYEENPPALPEFIRRDLRWCLGNLQYIRLLGASDLHSMGRLQLLLAVLMYVPAPAWLLMAILSLAQAASSGTLPIIASPVVAPLAADGAPVWWFVGLMLFLCFAPKLAGIAQALASRVERRRVGGGGRLVLSAAIELVVGTLLLPIIATAQTIFMGGLLGGRRIRWDAQQRDAREVSLAAACRGLWPHVALAAIYAGAVLVFAPQSWIAVLFFSVPLLLAIPFAVLSARRDVGAWFVRHRLCASPEELAPPPIVAAAGHLLTGQPRAAVLRARPGEPPQSTGAVAASVD